MKLKFTLLFATCIFLTLLMIQPFSSIASIKKEGEDKEKNKEKKSAKARTQSSRNNNSVKIYPDALKRVLHVVAKENDGKEIDFFVFDLEGTLMQHYKMETGDHKKITGIKRGKYVYRVFSGDEETATGELEIR
jgi:lipopolysaccharide export LptBFGC system permease protein LptF